LKKRKTAELLPEILIKAGAYLSIAIIVFIFFFVFSKAFPTIRSSGVSLFTTGGFDQQIRDAFNKPKGYPDVAFGMLGLLWGTFASTVLALVVATVLGIAAAIVIVEYAPRRVSAIFVGIVRLLASIPSIVFGLVGLVTVVPLVERLFVTTERQIEYLGLFQMTGRGLLSSVVVLTFMIVPMIISLSIDAMRGVQKNYIEAGYAFGMRRFRVVMKIILPSARSGIIASIILAAGRGIGEAIAVSMVCGGVGYLPDLSMGFATMLAPTLTLSSAIINKSEAMSVPAVQSALFACGAVLLIFGTVMSVGSRIIEHIIRKREGYDN
jgi:phosphate transport system permease protein